MGTRSLTFVKDGDLDSENCICMYRQYDGYPSGHGAELADFLSGYTILNGFGAERGKVANGMDCLSAQIVVHFKTQNMLGGIYLMPTSIKDAGQDYVYTVYLPEGATEPSIEVRDFTGKLLKDLPATKFLKWAEKDS